MIRVSRDLRRAERGYLLEVPLILVAVMVGLAIAVPNLENYPLIAKSLVGGGALIVIGCLYYMILTPGWQPNARPGKFSWNVLKFVVATAVVLAGAGAFIVFK